MIQAMDLLTLNRQDLKQLLISGFAIDPAALVDNEYRGIALGLPKFVERLSWKKFMKTFHGDPKTGDLRGWNVRIEASPLSDPSWTPLRRPDGTLRTFGHYRVLPIASYKPPLPVRHGLMIDYGLGGNAPWDLMRMMRDPLVSLREGSSELLLGWSYIDLGVGCLGTPSYFTLERHGALTHVVEAPRAARPRGPTSP